jgi:hypothetical protein
MCAQLGDVLESAEDGDLEHYCTPGVFVIKPFYGGAAHGILIIDLHKVKAEPVNRVYLLDAKIQAHLKSTVLPHLW